MAEITTYCTEIVEDGEKAKWVVNGISDKPYSEPTKTGYLFDGWKFDGTTYSPPYNASSNPFGPITEATDIKAVWDKLNIYADTNHTLISGDGDSDTDLTKLYYWVQSVKGTKITSGVTIEDVALDEDELPIVFDGSGSTAVVDNKNVKTVKVAENNINKPRYYRFKSKYAAASLESETIEIKQVGKDQTILPPFDYLTFTYSWSSDDGSNLDSATYVRNSNIPIESASGNKTLNDFYVGFSGISGHETTNPGMEVNQYIEHGGDNTSSGDEGAMVNWKKICDRDFISEGITTLYLDVYANWYHTKKNGKMSIQFKTYRGEDGLVKNGHTFEPTGDTVVVSTKELTNLSVYAFCSANTNNVKNYYSKVATVEYDIKSKSAVLIGEYTQSGREVLTTLKYNGSYVENIHSDNVTVESMNVDNSAHSGTYTLSKLTEQIDGGTITTYDLKDTVRVSDDYGSATMTKDSDGNVTVNWNIEANTSGSSRILSITINTDSTTAYSSGHSLILSVHQAA